MRANHITERIQLHSKLLMATIAGIFLDAGGVAGLMAVQNNPPFLNWGFGMIEAGGAIFVLLSVAGCALLRIIFNLINQLEANHGGR